MLIAIVGVAVLATATLSGIIGMAGGMVLMALLVLLMPVASAMILHGVAQGVSNGARALLLRQHIVWSILPPYILGAAVAVGLFVWLALVPDRALILIMIGSFVWLARLVPYLSGLNVQRPATAVACGLIVTIAQLLAGASGPLLDLFYLNTQLDRFQIIASKAVTQTLGHIVKIGYYGFIGAQVVERALPATELFWLCVVAAPAAVAGARIGTLLLARLSDAQFRRYSQWAILTLASVCIIGGIADLLQRP